MLEYIAIPYILRPMLRGRIEKLSATVEYLVEYPVELGRGRFSSTRFNVNYCILRHKA